MPEALARDEQNFSARAKYGWGGGAFTIAKRSERPSGKWRSEVPKKGAAEVVAPNALPKKSQGGHQNSLTRIFFVAFRPRQIMGAFLCRSRCAFLVPLAAPFFRLDVDGGGAAGGAGAGW